MSKTTILLVQKEEEELKKTKKLLIDKGYEVLAHIKAVDAIESIYNARPSVVISDTLLSGLGGYHIAEEIQKSRMTRSIPIVLLYTDNSPIDSERNKQLNILFSIKKPYKDDDLVSKIKFLVREMAKIMVVSHERMYRTRVFNQLKEDGFTVFEEQKPKDAIESIPRTLPHLIVLDDAFPHIDIIDFLDKIKEQNPNNPVPVILMIDPKSGSTNVRTEDDIKEMQQHGIKAFLKRHPFDIILLYKKFTKVLVPIYQDNIRYPAKFSDIKEKLDKLHSPKGYTIKADKKVLIVVFDDEFKASNIVQFIKDWANNLKTSVVQSKVIFDVSKLPDNIEQELNHKVLSTILYAIKTKPKNIIIVRNQEQTVFIDLFSSHSDLRQSKQCTSIEEALSLLES